MEKWPLGVFASIDAGLGVQSGSRPRVGRADVQLHAPHKATPHASEHAERVPGPAQGAGHPHHAWSSAASRARATPTSPTVVRTVGLVPPDTRAARTAGDEGNRRFRPAAGRRRRGPAHRLRAARRRPIRSTATCVAVTRETLRPLQGQRPEAAPGDRPGIGRRAACSSSATSAATTCSSTSIRPT